MDKNLEFAQYLNTLMTIREKQILHDLSNKFNVLTLALEDLEEVIEDSSSDLVKFKNDISTELSTVIKAKGAYLELSDRLKNETSGNFKEATFEDIFNLSLLSLQKDIRKKGLTIKYNSPSQGEVRFRSAYTLFCAVILLRCFYPHSDKTFLLDFSEKEGFFKEEKSFLDDMAAQVGQNFKGMYLGYLEELWNESLLY